MANYPQELAQDAVCQSHTGHMTGLWFLPTRPLRLNTNEWINSYVAQHTHSWFGDVAIWRSVSNQRLRKWKSKVFFQMYLCLYRRNFPETALHIPHCHLVQPMYVWRRSVINSGHFAWRPRHLLGGVWSLGGGICKIVHICHCTWICCKLCVVICKYSDTSANEWHF